MIKPRLDISNLLPVNFSKHSAKTVASPIYLQMFYFTTPAFKYTKPWAPFASYKLKNNTTKPVEESKRCSELSSKKAGFKRTPVLCCTETFEVQNSR